MPYAPESLAKPEPERSFSPHRKIYKTAAWLRFRTYRLSLNPTCQECERHGYTTQAIDVHHLVPLRDMGDAFSIKNTECLCKECHGRLTRAGK